MALDPLTAVLNIGNTLLDRLLPDKQANDAAKVQLAQMALQGELNGIAGQLEINKVEAASQSVFVAGWRPFVGWVCGVGAAYAFVVQPMAQFILVAAKVNFDIAKLPNLNIIEMLGLLTTMLGFGVMRTIDKGNGSGNGQ